MNVNLQPREGALPPVKNNEPDKSGGKKERPDKGKKGGGKGGGKSGGTSESTGGFKPVGD